MGSISHHKLLIASGGHTHAHTNIRTHKHTYRCPHRNNFKKPGMSRPQAGARLVYNAATHLIAGELGS